jgi:hypothetical protein
MCQHFLDARDNALALLGHPIDRASTHTVACLVANKLMGGIRASDRRSA